MDTKIYYKDNNAIIVCGDMLEDNRIPDAHIDLIVTSPPYNVNKNYGKAKDNLSYEEYTDFTEKWLKNVMSFQNLTAGYV